MHCCLHCASSCHRDPGRSRMETRKLNFGFAQTCTAVIRMVVLRVSFALRVQGFFMVTVMFLVQGWRQHSSPYNTQSIPKLPMFRECSGGGVGCICEGDAASRRPTWAVMPYHPFKRPFIGLVGGILRPNSPCW